MRPAPNEEKRSIAMLRYDEMGEGRVVVKGGQVGLLSVKTDQECRVGK